MTDNLDFFVTTMPAGREADYYLGCLEGSVFMDFNNYGETKVCLIRISFDGYGCCNLGKDSIPMDETDSTTFKEMIKEQLPDQFKLTAIVKKTISDNKRSIWEDALNEYGLI
jgi:hypothetical protein